MIYHTREVTRWCVGLLTVHRYGPRRRQCAVLFQPSAVAEFRGWEVMAFATLADAKDFFRRRSHLTRFMDANGAISVHVPVEMDPT